MREGPELEKKDVKEKQLNPDKMAGDLDGDCLWRQNKENTDRFENSASA